MSCETLKSRKKRTIANLLQADQQLSALNEKKTFVKEYFDNKSPEQSGDQSMRIMELILPIEAEQTVPAIKEEPCSRPQVEEPVSIVTPSVPLVEVNKNVKKSKVKDYVCDENMNCAKPKEVPVDCTVVRKRISRVRQRKSKIKDYILNEVNQLDSPEIIEKSEGDVTASLSPISLPTAQKENRPKYTKLKSKRTKIKDYMITDMKMAKSNQLQCKNGSSNSNYYHKKISNIISFTTPALSPASKTTSNSIYLASSSPSETVSKSLKSSRVGSFKKPGLFKIKLEPHETYTKSTIKSILQTKCSRAKLIKNKENLNQLKSSSANSSQFLVIKN